MHFSMLAATAALGLFQTALAHTTMNQIWINDQTQGLGTCIRHRKDRSQAVNPIAPNSPDLACGVEGDKPVAFTCGAKAGDKLTFGFNFGKLSENPDGHFARSHKGPCSVMAKKVDSATSATGSGGGWFRIFYEGYNKESGKWCTERMMENGMLSISIPGDLAPGDYLFRSELLALHSAVHGDPQFYVSCAQIFLSSGGSSTPSNTVSLPSDSYAQPGTSAMNFNYYYPPNAAESYPNYGPPSYKPTGSGGSNTLQQKDGLRPKDCILQIENWCGPEVPSYDSNSCWESHKKCNEIAQTCWNGVVVDNSRCSLYADKCKAMEQLCRQGGSGPPNAGQDITPKPQGASCPAPLNDPGTISTYPSGGSSSVADAQPTASAIGGYDIKGKQQSVPSSDEATSAPSSAASTAVSPEGTSSPAGNYASSSSSSSPSSVVSPGETSSPAAGYEPATSPATSPVSSPASSPATLPASSPASVVSPDKTSSPAAGYEPATSSASVVSPENTSAPSGCPSAVTVTKTVTETVSVAPGGKQSSSPAAPGDTAAATTSTTKKYGGPSTTASASPTTNTADANGAITTSSVSAPGTSGYASSGSPSNTTANATPTSSVSTPGASGYASNGSPSDSTADATPTSSVSASSASGYASSGSPGASTADANGATSTTSTTSSSSTSSASGYASATGSSASVTDAVPTTTDAPSSTPGSSYAAQPTTTTTRRREYRRARRHL